MIHEVKLARSIRNRLCGLGAGALLLGVLGFVLAPLAFARVTYNTIDSVARVSHGGRHVDLTGPIVCDQTQAVRMRVTVTQRTTGAVAEGYASFTGTQETQTWHVHAVARGPDRFVPGDATAVGLAMSTGSPGHNDDAHQWLVPVTLVEE